MRCSRGVFFIVLAILVVAFIHYATIVPGHDWGGDFSMYVHHAKNIVEGKGYSDTGYIFNPKTTIGPQNYPPGFPLILAPVYAVYGLDFMAFKAVITLFLLGLAVVFYLGFMRELSARYLVVVILVFSISPFMVKFKNNVLSDIPFTFFVYLSLYVINRNHGGDVRWWCPLLAGALMGYCYLIRPIGAVLPVALFAYDLIVFRRVSGFTLKSVCVFALFFVVNSAYFGDVYYYYKFIGERNLYDSLVVYSQRLMKIGESSVQVVGIHSLIILAGYLAKVRRKITVYEVFAPLYVIPLLMVTYAEIRLLIPLAPLLVFYAYYPAYWMESSTSRSGHVRLAGKVFFALLTIMIIFSYKNQMSRMDFGPVRNGPTSEVAGEMFDFIRENPSDGPYIFYKPRVMALFTGKKASARHRDWPVKEWEYCRSINATHIVEHTDKTYPIVETHLGQLDLVFSNWRYLVYEIRYDDGDGA
ncbi:MAG: glycosyltransferase family 39 protein [Candidatus Altiarchaeota archaeon]